MIFGLLNARVIRDVGQMAQFGRFPSLQLLQATVSVVAGDLQFREEFHETKMYTTELVPQRTVPTLHRIVGSWAVVLVMVPQRDFLCRQPRPLEVLMEAVDMVSNLQIVGDRMYSEHSAIGGAKKLHLEEETTLPFAECTLSLRHIRE